MTRSAHDTLPQIPRGSRGRVFLLDDHPKMVRSLTLILVRQGFEVASATTGREALELAPAFAPRVALLDIEVPDLSGVEVARALRREPGTRSTHLVALTGHSDDRLRSELEAVGFCEHLVKPVDFPRLFRLLDSLV